MIDHALKKLPYIIKYVPDRYKTQWMCDNVFLENGEMLMFIPNSYKNKKMCNKAVGDYAHALRSFLDCYNTQKMCNEAVGTHKVVSEEPFVFKYCDKAVDKAV